MRNGSRMWRFTSAAVAGVAAAAVLAPAATAAETAAPVPGGRNLTVNDYLSYLDRQKTPMAEATLKAFQALPLTKKIKFVGYLQNRTVHTALIGSLKGTTKPRQHQSVVHYNQDVSFVRGAQVTRTDTGDSTIRVSFTLTEHIFSIPVTRERVWVMYESKQGKAVKIVDGGAQVTNVNAAVKIEAAKAASTTLNGQAAHTSVRWNTTPLYRSFGAGLAKEQKVSSGWTGVWKAALNNV